MAGVLGQLHDHDRVDRFYFGLTGISTMVTVIGANVAMILFGWLQESFNPPGRNETTMLPFWFGTIAGLAPWVAIAINLVGAEQIPGFVLGIAVSLLIAFFTFAVNQWLQYRQVGPWRDYAFGENTYLVLSLVAKSLLAWQIFAGSLAS
ncbi:heliorhodopsin HeR [Nakamurella flavida]|uniref:Heliorhodopsin HeR n=1 Tax=Nakamurella flavida TaxID=363630 RepID=A0A939C174_9ACTN|nr:heliorhodopsin HeR [Nakamurella flavida]MBM9475155.1 heliorhodopsin HeR [Nakamurella flavida]